MSFLACLLLPAASPALGGPAGFHGDGEIYYEVCHTSYQPTLLMHYFIKGDKLRIDWADFEEGNQQDIQLRDVLESAIMDFHLKKMWILDPQKKSYMILDFPVEKEKGESFTFSDQAFAPLLVAKTPVPVVKGTLQKGDISASVWLATEMGPFLGFQIPPESLQKASPEVQEQVHDGLFPIRMEFKNPKAHQYLYMIAMKIKAGTPKDELFQVPKDYQKGEPPPVPDKDKDRFFKSMVPNP